MSAQGTSDPMFAESYFEVPGEDYACVDGQAILPRVCPALNQDGLYGFRGLAETGE